MSTYGPEDTPVLVDRIPLKARVAIDLIHCLQPALVREVASVNCQPEISYSRPVELMTPKEEAAYGAALDYLERFLDGPDSHCFDPMESDEELA